MAKRGSSTTKRTAKRGSAPHERTRADHATELAEDYVEAIAELADAEGRCRASDLARRFGVTPVTVSRTIGRLARDGFVTTEPYGPVELTAAGRRLAAAARTRHEVVLAFLRTLGVDEKTAAIDAEGIEHHVSPQTLARMEAFVADRESN